MTGPALTREEEWARYWPTVAAMVRAGEVRWRDHPPLGFRWGVDSPVGTGRSDDYHLLCVLWTAKGRGLIRVLHGRVEITDEGAREASAATTTG